MSTDLQALRQQAKLPAKQAGGMIVSEFFERNKSSIMAVLPKHVSADRMLKIAMGAMRTTPKLMDCTVESLFGAVVQCAQLGLEPNTPMGHAYLIAFRNNAANRTDVQVIIGYRGLIDLARRSGQIVSIASHSVHENDEFVLVFGLEERLEHRPASRARGEVTHFYAVAKLVGGGHALEVMSREDVDAVMRATRSGGRHGPWRDHYEEMGRKTVIRRLFKYLPVSIELATATALDVAAEIGEAQNLGAVIDGDYAVTETQQEADDETPTDVQAEDSPDDTARPQASKRYPAHPHGETDGELWPSQNTDPATGEITWLDSRGISHNPLIHGRTSGGTPAVTKAGHFTRRRGCDSDAHAKIEREMFAKLKAAAVDNVGDAEAAMPRTERSGPVAGYPQIMQAIQRSQNADDVASAEDLLRSYNGLAPLREELETALGMARANLAGG